MELCHGRVRLGIRKRFFSQRCWGTKQVPQRMGTTLELPELKEC